MSTWNECHSGAQTTSNDHRKTGKIETDAERRQKLATSALENRGTMKD